MQDITIDIHNYPSNVTRQDIMDMLREMDRKEAEVREQLEDDLREKDEEIDDLKHKYYQF
jgi:hypothetical protein